MRRKNALRGHFVAEFDQENPKQEPSEWLELAKWIDEITDDTDETTEESGDYAGDGNPSTEVISVAEAWTVSGTYDDEDPAQKLIVSKKRKTGQGRKLWHRVVESNTKKQWTGVATATEIIGGSGAATDYEAFGCKLTFEGLPKESVPVGVGG